MHDRVPACTQNGRKSQHLNANRNPHHFVRKHWEDFWISSGRGADDDDDDDDDCLKSAEGNSAALLSPMTERPWNFDSKMPDLDLEYPAALKSRKKLVRMTLFIPHSSVVY
jgi:hypothetical protein